MRSILFFSPVPISSKPSGISIRLLQLKSQFEKIGFKTKITHDLKKENINSAEFVYIMISTKKDSISSEVASQQPNRKLLIVDLYTPIILEKEAFLTKWKPVDWRARVSLKKNVANILKAGNYFLVANKRQKEYWHEISKQLNVPIPRDNIFTIPTGAPESSVIKNQPANIILWFGGIYPWMNPLPLIQAFSKISLENPSWKLRFLGGFHPNTGYQSIYHDVIKEARKAIPKRSLEVITWQEKHLLDHLKDIAIAVNIPKKTKEDYYAHRVRLLTLSNSGIPIITSGKDMISNLVVKLNAGLSTTGIVIDLERKLRYVINNPLLLAKWRKNTLKVQSQFINNENDLKKLILLKNEK